MDEPPAEAGESHFEEVRVGEVQGPAPFGQQFMAEVRMRFKSSLGWDYATITEILQADRERFISLCARNPPSLPYLPREFAELVRTWEPAPLVTLLYIAAEAYRAAAE